MKTYIPLHNHTEFSLKDGISKIKHIPARLKELEISGCAITDHGTLSGSVSFYKTLKKENIKAILGLEHYICRQDCSIQTPENRKCDHLLILAKNTAGWKNLLNLTYDSNIPERFYHNPRINLERLPDYTTDGNLIGIAGHMGSVVAKEIINDDKISQNWKNNGVKIAKQLQDIFGKDNFYLEVQLIDTEQQIVRDLAECVREISNITNIPTVATGDCHYLRQQDNILQQIMVCENLNIKLSDGPTSGMSGFFRCNNFYMPSYDEMINFGNTEKELEQTLEIASKCEDYDILRNPEIPQYKCPEGYDENTWLRKLCWEGWQQKIEGKISEDQKQTYIDRVKYELGVLKDAKLANYFLTVKDIVDFGRTCGLMGCGRGSVAGSEVAYLLNITQVDSIKYNLIFERFYNSSRTGSLPDVDIDCPQGNRSKILEYITNKFGHDYTIQVATFSSLKGRNVVKSVLRSYGDISFTEMNEITKHFPEPSKILGELHEQEEEFGEQSIVRYVLDNDKKGVLKDYCYFDDKGNLQGKLSKRFAQMISLENTKVNRSTHAAGVVISPQKIRDSIPVVYDTKNKKLISSLEMHDLENIGKVKFDLLGLATLDKIDGVQQLLKHKQLENLDE